MHINWHRIIEQGQREPDSVRLKVKVIQGYKKGFWVKLSTGHRTLIPYSQILNIDEVTPTPGEKELLIKLIPASTTAACNTNFRRRR